VHYRGATQLAGLAFVALLAAGCGGVSSPTAGSDPTGASTTAAARASTTPSSPTGLIGSWHRAQTCSEMLAAFTAAGLAKSHVAWIQDNFGQATTGSAACGGAPGPVEHSHFFTDSGSFGSRDDQGQEVDDGDFKVIDSDTISFPSHADEFGYDGDLVVDYAVAGDEVTFDVAVPATCEGACADAYAWALSAFASGPWQRADAP
jgi:hypothetical protein